MEKDELLIKLKTCKDKRDRLKKKAQYINGDEKFAVLRLIEFYNDKIEKLEKVYNAHERS